MRGGAGLRGKQCAYERENADGEKYPDTENEEEIAKWRFSGADFFAAGINYTPLKHEKKRVAKTESQAARES